MKYTPTTGGITQLTGDATAGPGSGSQALTLASVTTAETVGDATHYPVVTTDAKGRVTGMVATAVPAGVNPATTVVGPDAYGAAAVVGTSALYARGDHNHGLPAAPSAALTNSIAFTSSATLALTANSNTQVDSIALAIGIYIINISYNISLTASPTSDGQYSSLLNSTSGYITFTGQDGYRIIPASAPTTLIYNLSYTTIITVTAADTLLIYLGPPVAATVNSESVYSYIKIA